MATMLSKRSPMGVFGRSPMGVRGGAIEAFFVAVCDTIGNSGGMYSPNGIDWYASATANGSSVCYGAFVGTWVSVSPNGGIKSSTDGIVWTTRTSANGAVTAVCWSETLHLFVAVGTGTSGTTTNQVQTSPNGINWTARAGINNAVGGPAWGKVVWSPDVNLFVTTSITRPTNGKIIMSSPDGIAWTGQTTAVGVSPAGRVAWGQAPGVFAVVGSNAGFNDNNQISTNGVLWTAGALGEFHYWTDITYASDLAAFCAVAAAGTNRIATSTDGSAWGMQANVAGNPALNAVCYSSTKSLLVAVGNNIVQSSPTGVAWTARTPVNKNWFAVACKS